MSTEITTQTRSKLEKLTPEQKSYIVELARNATYENIVDALKGHGISTSASALRRFVRKRRSEELVETGGDVASAAAALAEQGRAGTLRVGTLEVLRQTFFEKAADGQSPEDARKMYDALVKEETRVKELELEARKVATLENQVRLQARRIEIDALKARAAIGRVKGAVVDSTQDVAAVEPICLEAPQVHSNVEPVAPSVPPQQFVELVTRAADVLNRGGDMADRIVQARALLAEALRDESAQR